MACAFRATILAESLPSQPCACESVEDVGSPKTAGCYVHCVRIVSRSQCRIATSRAIRDRCRIAERIIVRSRCAESKQALNKRSICSISRPGTHYWSVRTVFHRDDQHMVKLERGYPCSVKDSHLRSCCGCEEHDGKDG